MTLGSLACTTLTLQLGAENLADALRMKQTLQSKGMDILNGCWNSDSSWQLLVLEDSGMAQRGFSSHYGYHSQLSSTCSVSPYSWHDLLVCLELLGSAASCNGQVQLLS